MRYNYWRTCITKMTKIRLIIIIIIAVMNTDNTYSASLMCQATYDMHVILSLTHLAQRVQFVSSNSHLLSTETEFTTVHP